jgi:thiol-disulfide isomerase/thioredoxin
VTKKNIIACAVTALLFGAMGMVVGVNKNPPAPPTTAAAGATVTGTAGTGAPTAEGAVRALYSQQLPDAKGVPQALSKWKGKALVVNFWAPWCGPCVEEMPELSRVQVENAAKNIQIIGIGIDSAKNIAQFDAKFKIAYPLYVAGMGGTDLALQFGNTAGGLPYTVLIGADGMVKKTYRGRLKFDRLRADLAAL